MADVQQAKGHVTLVDHGAGKSYLGFILYDLFCKEQPGDGTSHIYGIETREELVAKSTEPAVGNSTCECPLNCVGSAIIS